jgi:alanyl-tRNA synthetase
MTSRELRRSFLDFFASKGHKIVPSAPVVPHGDPTLLFTNAGMNQFKDVFLGTGSRDYSRCADTQKCIRVSGKHNDLEEVGYDTYHHTLFEMLGNWSFGDYYKKEAIAWAWELLTEMWKLPKERLHATVYRTDDEAMELWKQYLPADRIHRFDEKDNFWEMGDTGPCGPCTEIHFDRTPDLSGGPLVNAGVPEVMEIWNLVFIQYNRRPDGTLEELTSRHVDTGMGFERICAVMQGKNSNYDTDVFTPIISQLEQLSSKEYSPDLENKNGIAMRVIADHIRTLVFSIADGATPGNEGRGYVLRRILRRACRYARNLGFREAVLYKLTKTLVDTMGDVFPEIIVNQSHIERIIRAEEDSFLQTLERGLERFNEIENKLRDENSEVIAGADAFLLYDSFGFPLDLTALLARERNIAVDTEGFTTLMAAQRERSRNARKQHIQQVETESTDAVSTFTGWSSLEVESEVLYAHENQIITAATPFYVEMGGQTGDTGSIIMGGNTYSVIDTRKNGQAIIHFCDTDVEPLQGTIARLQVDQNRRWDIQRNHSATHLVHEALRRVLGTHVQQSGSLVAPEHLRFDFSHFQKVSASEIQEIEHIVNEKIRERIPVITQELTIDEARKIPGVKMFFGDKYGQKVRVVTIDEKFSSEFCGGTHVQNSSDIGLFKIVGEMAVASGIRRIEAITSAGIMHYITRLQEQIQQQHQATEQAQEQLRRAEKDLNAFRVENLAVMLPALVEKAALLPGTDIRIITVQADGADTEILKSLGDRLRSAIGNKGIGLIASVADEKVNLVCVVTDDLTKTYNAGKIVGATARRLGGGGGGKPHMATAGARDINALPAILQSFAEIVQNPG